MSADYAEKEREFLASLEADTGRNLEAWMAAIETQGLTERNAIIDWLREQGFLFSKASWLERIHNNSGKPIYGVGAARARAVKRPRSKPGPSSPPANANPAPDAPARAEEPPAAPPKPDRHELDALLATAKAFRPLATFVLAEIDKAVPGVRLTAGPGHVAISAEREFAVLTVGPRELRLGLALGGRPVEPPFQAARFTNPSARISPLMTHMVILTDARQVTGALLALVREAAQSTG